MYTPKQALKITRYKQAMHNALCVCLGTGALAAFVMTIGYVNADGGTVGAALSMGASLVLAFLAWCADMQKEWWAEMEKRVTRRYEE